jgi:hypothetical protein
MNFRYYPAIIMFALLVAAGNSMAAPSKAAIENWACNYPDAAYELWSWSKENPAAARKFSEWERINPERAKSFFTWATSHPGKGVDAFMENHPGWTDFGALLERHRLSARSLLVWCRQYPGAARSLIKISRRNS